VLKFFHWLFSKFNLVLVTKDELSRLSRAAQKSFGKQSPASRNHMTSRSIP